LTPRTGLVNVRRVMPQPTALACVRCSARYPVDHYAQDCPACRAKGAPANLTVAYDSVPGSGTDRDAILGHISRRREEAAALRKQIRAFQRDAERGGDHDLYPWLTRRHALAWAQFTVRWAAEAEEAIRSSMPS